MVALPLPLCEGVPLVRACAFPARSFDEQVAQRGSFFFFFSWGGSAWGRHNRMQGQHSWVRAHARVPLPFEKPIRRCLSPSRGPGYGPPPGRVGSEGPSAATPAAATPEAASLRQLRGEKRGSLAPGRACRSQATQPDVYCSTPAQQPSGDPAGR